MNKGDSFIEDKIFKLTSTNLITDNHGNKRDFKYVVLKINKIKSDAHGFINDAKVKVLIQLVDMSNSILYNEVKAEKSFLTIINAAFSHELRNPLNSLTGQISSMRNLFHSFSNIILIFK